MNNNDKKDPLGEPERHPSFGMVTISHYTCTPPQNFFGSAVRHSAGVSFTIYTGEVHRSLSNDWYHARNELIEINMTASQFGELLTRFNVGDGTPCTINHVCTPVIVAEFGPDEKGKYQIPRCPEINTRQQIGIEFKESMRELGESLTSLLTKARELQTKPSITKADRKAYLDIALGLQSQIQNGLPFINAQFNESLDKMLLDAKANLESFTSQLARSLGAEELQKRLMAETELVKPALLEKPAIDVPTVEPPKP